MMTVRQSIVVFTAVCFFPLLSLAAGPQTQPSEADRRAEATLEKQVPSVDFVNVTLGDAVNFLRDVSGANIYANWRAIEASGVISDEQITMHLRQISLAKVLTTVLDDAAGAHGKLDYIVDQGVITISTAEDLKRNTVIRVYDVKDILAVPAGEAPGEPTITPKKAEMFVGLIQDIIDPDSWTVNGGHSGTIKYLNGQFVISQTPKNHDALAKLFKALRELR